MGCMTKNWKEKTCPQCKKSAEVIHNHIYCYSCGYKGDKRVYDLHDIAASLDRENRRFLFF